MASANVRGIAPSHISQVLTYTYVVCACEGALSSIIEELLCTRSHKNHLL